MASLRLQLLKADYLGVEIIECLTQGLWLTRTVSVSFSMAVAYAWAPFWDGLRVLCQSNRP